MSATLRPVAAEAACRLSMTFLWAAKSPWEKARALRIETMSMVMEGP